MSWESQCMALLSASLVRPFVLAVAAWMILRAFRVRHPASRHAVWTVVLAGLLVLPLVSVLAPHWRIAPHWKAPVLPRNGRTSTPVVQPPPVALREPLLADSPEQDLLPPPRTFSVPSLLLWCYLAGLFAMTSYRAVGWVLLRRVLRRSTPLKQRILRESGDVATPVAVGVLRPAVLLPAGWRDWNRDTRRAVLAHEFAHIRRNDALISALGRLVKSVLWFHPLAWWVSRKVSELAELACDAVALDRVGDPAGYSRILLRFADQVNRAGHRAALPGSAMADSSSRMGKRIDQVFELASGEMRKLARPRVWMALVGLPVMCLAATVGLRESNARPSLVQVVLPIVFPKAPSAPIPGYVIAQASPPPVRPLPASPLPQGPVPQSHSVVVRTTVADPSGAVAEDLPQSAFKVFEDGVEQPLTMFREEKLPVSIGLVADDSGSMRDRRATLAAAAKALVKFSDPQDEMFVVHFTENAHIDQDWTNNENKLEAEIGRIGARGGSSLRDAVSLSLDKMQSGGKNETKVLFLITDGADNTSKIGQEELVLKARHSGVRIYSIGLSNDEGAAEARAAKRTLHELAEASGGQDYYPNGGPELEKMAAHILHQIHDQYLLEYLAAPALDPGFRDIRVEVNRPDLIIRATTGVR